MYDINLKFLQEVREERERPPSATAHTFASQVEKKFPDDRAKISRMSLIEEGSVRQVRMAYLAVIGSHRVNGVAELHSGLVKEMFHDFVDFFGKDHFTNVTNGITARRWLLQCNPGLASLITRKLGNDQWLVDLNLLQGLNKFADDPETQREFFDVKAANKDRLATYVETTLGISINVSHTFTSAALLADIALSAAQRSL